MKIAPLTKPVTVMIYGGSSSGKTTMLKGLAMWMYELSGLTSRLISSDPGGWDTLERDEIISNKIVDPLNWNTRKKLLADTRKLSRGEWLKIVPKLDEDGNQLIKGGKRVFQKIITEDREAYEKIGLYYVDGVTSMSDSWMRYIVQKSELIDTEYGPKVKDIGAQGTVGRYEEDGEVFGNNSMSHYNTIQLEVHGMMSTFSGMAPPVRMVCYTAQEGKGTIRKTGEGCICPLLVGDKKNALVPSWVSECFHLEDTPEIRNSEGEIIQRKEVRAYYENHMTSDGQTLCLAKSRSGLYDLEELKEAFPGGYIPIGIKDGDGLDKYYRWLEERKGRNFNRVKEWKDRVDAKLKEEQ